MENSCGALYVDEKTAALSATWLLKETVIKIFVLRKQLLQFGYSNTVIVSHLLSDVKYTALSMILSGCGRHLGQAGPGDINRLQCKIIDNLISKLIHLTLLV